MLKTKKRLASGCCDGFSTAMATLTNGIAIEVLIRSLGPQLTDWFAAAPKTPELVPEAVHGRRNGSCSGDHDVQPLRCLAALSIRIKTPRISSVSAGLR